MKGLAEMLVRQFCLIFFRVFLLVAAMALSFSPSWAVETITSFHSNIVVEKNGDLLVTETIKVITEGKHIKRGIYRDFPRLAEIDGTEKKVGFDILTIKRDGRNEPYHTESRRHFTRIYIGDQDVYLTPAKYTYQITYRTDRQLRFFSNYDELLWNVTGTEWIFPILMAGATISLPQNIAATNSVYFTGEFGSVEQNASVNMSSGRRVINFTTTLPLGVREGLTFGIKMPKGSFDPVPDGKSWEWFWRDFGGEVLAIIALLISSLYFITKWFRIGRDPAPGIITPRWHMPNDVSPALVNYIEEEGNSSSYKGVIAAFLNLAVKGYVTIEGLDQKPTITRTDKASDSRLGVGEGVLVKKLDARDNRSIKISKNNGGSVKAMSSAFRQALNQEHENVYYRHNWPTILIGFMIAIAGLIAIVVFGNLNEDTIGWLIASFFLIVVLTIGLAIISYVSGLDFDPVLFAVIIVLAGVCAFSFGPHYLSFLSGFEDWVTQPILLLAILLIVTMSLNFFFLIGAPTAIGRKRMNEMEGLRTYLELAEKDRLNLAGAPKMSPKHFETLLPYAVAMGVEKPWADSFQSWLAAAAVAGAGAAAHHYTPDWYNGRFDTDHIGDELGGISNSMSSSFTASLPTPKSSSSGFSGGSSGGGGGGGGGGGW